MKKATLFLLLLFIQLTLFSQQPFPINGISTNPAAPVNPGNPAKLNRFDWLLPNYSINTTCQNMANGVTQSPFYRGGNTQLLTFLKDMLPEDGWELIHKDFGYEDDNTTPAIERKEHSWLVLYNKYTGILRLIFKTCRGEDYDAMKIVVQFQNLPGKIQTNLFDLSNQNLSSTEAERANGTQKFESVVKFVNDQSQWFYTDFPMHFDPCTCMYQSNINVITNLVRTANIKLQGTASGTLKTIANISNGKGTINDDSKIGFKDMYTDAKKQITNVLPSMEAFYSLASSIASSIPTDSIKQDEIKAAVSLLSTNSKLSGFLKNTLLKDAPWVGSAMSLVDFLVLGGKKAKPQPIELMPMSIAMDINLTGTITTESNYHNFHFDNPGSKDAGVSISKDYPIYNEAMGIFTLLNNPVLLYRDNQGGYPPLGTFRDYTFLASPRFYYSLNPASGLKIHDIQAQIIAEYFSNAPYIQGNEFFAFPNDLPANPVNGLKRRGSLPFDLKCMGKDNTMFTQKTYVESIPGTPINNIPTNNPGNFVKIFYLKLIINLERLDGLGQNILLVQTYPIDLVKAPDNNNSIHFPPYQYPYTDFYMPKHDICSASPLFQRASTDDDGEFMYQFCYNTRYKDKRPSFSSSARVGTDNSEPATSTKADSSISSANKLIQVYPNPATNWLTVSNMSDKTLNQIKIVGSNGAVLQLLSTRQAAKKIDVSKLPGGFYIVEIQNAAGKVSKKVIIQRN